MIWTGFLVFSILLVIIYKIFPFVLALFTTTGVDFFHAVTDSSVLMSSKVSFFWALVSSLVLTFLSLYLAWYLRNKRRLLYIIIFVPWAVPLYLSAMAMRFAVYGIGSESIISYLYLNGDILTDPVAAYIWTLALSSWVNLPIITLSFLSSIDEIPKETLEAARIDGADDEVILHRIVIPQIFPMVSGWFLMYFVRFFHSFTIPFLFADGGVLIDGWITKWGWLGNLSTLGYLNYKVYSMTSDFSLLAAYSSVTLIMMVFISMYWFFKDREKIIRVSTVLFSTFWALLQGWIFPVLFMVLTQMFWKKRKILLALSMVVFAGSGFNFIPAGTFMLWLILTGRLPQHRPLKSLGKLIFGASFSLAVFFTFLITASLFLTAFTDFPDTMKIHSISFNPIIDVVKEGYVNYLSNSLEIAIPIAVFVPIISVPLAFYVSRRGEGLLQLFILLQSIGGFHLLVQIFIMYSKIGLVNKLIGVTLLVSANVLPQIVVMQRSYLKGFPKELEEMALLDGGKHFVRRLVFRYAIPVVFVGALIGFMGGWNTFLAPLVLLLSEDKFPLSLKLYDYVGNLRDKYPDWNSFGAMAVLNLAIVLVLFIINRRLSKKLKMQG